VAKSKRGTDRYIVVDWKHDRWRIWRDGKWWNPDSKPRKFEAVRYATAIARKDKRELVVKTKDGRIAYRRSYGNDSPRRPG